MMREPGLYDYSPLVDRPKITWPNDARIAFWVAPNIEYYEYVISKTKNVNRIS